MKKLYALLTFLFIAFTGNAQWATLGSGLNSEANALTFYNGELYAGGMFTVAGDTAASYIAKWTGTEWHPVGTGVNAPVKALAVYNGELYAGGFFTEAGGIPVRMIAKWNGAVWDSVGTGINDSGFVSALAVHNNELYAGGQFSSAGSVSPVNNIARWNGTSWSAAGYGFTSQFFPQTIVKSLVSHQGSLFAAGSFDHAESDFAIGIAEWDGTIWSDLSFGFNHEGLSVASYGGFLYLGGAFNQHAATNDPMARITQWDGTSWEQVGAGTDTTVTCLAVFRNELYVGGYFKKANNLAVKHLAVYNGGTFEGVPFGTDTAVTSMAADTNALYISGLFTVAGGIPASHIAKYMGPTSVPEGTDSKLAIVPNPAQDVITITGYGDASDITVSIVDLCGREVGSKELRSLKETIDISDLSKGAYLLKVSSEGKVISSGRLIKS